MNLYYNGFREIIKKKGDFMMDLSWVEDLKKALEEFNQHIDVRPNQILVVGCSSSEIIGKRIGTEGNLDIAKAVFDVVYAYAQKNNLYLAIQCCEHLNRALVVSREVQKAYHLDEVSVVPIKQAGGSLAAHAYLNLNDACLVEFIKADYGIDIGDTLIGMHLKHVAVPQRVSIKHIGHAHLTLAKTRPKLIGGNRAVYCL